MLNFLSRFRAARSAGHPLVLFIAAIAMTLVSSPLISAHLHTTYPYSTQHWDASGIEVRTHYDGHNRIIQVTKVTTDAYGVQVARALYPDGSVRCMRGGDELGCPVENYHDLLDGDPHVVRMWDAKAGRTRCYLNVYEVGCD